MNLNNQTDSSLEEQLRLVCPETGTVLMSTCLNVSFYFRDANSPEKRQAVLNILSDYQTMMADKLNWTTNPQTGAWKNLRKKAYTSPHDWLLSLPDEPWEFIYHGGEHHRDASDIRFNILANAAWEDNKGHLSWLTINFPLTFFADWPESLQDVLLRWLAELQPLHGLASLATTHNHFKDYQHEPVEYNWSQQFPGLDISGHIDHGLYLQQGIKGINWLTFVHQDYLAQVGGLDALKGVQGLTAYQAGEVYMLQAANMPALQHIPETYYQLGAVLKPIRNTELYNIHHFKGEDGTFSGKGYFEWLARFDKEVSAKPIEGETPVLGKEPSNDSSHSNGA
ncbi:DUF3396 domain-containing protein [Shewanella sp. VB17]|uniref:type VI immunity family protein n=1 Tax=Shewanella sp. VB17 TaxID=2739432 RepID=UPI00156489C9|nr:type VI immunity family protein [Shewanella sp. VB17]NRD72167.1 DUF3396 domain-containing protein [Shewanella sp. VB17]